MRVVHVITTLTTGGAERQLELLVQRTAAATATVCLYEAGPVGDAMRARGDRVRVLGMAGWRKPLAVLRLARVLRAHAPDVVHVHLLAAQLWGIPAARMAGVRVVVSSEHSLMADTVEGRPHAWWLRLLYRGLERAATHTVAVSETTAERLVGWGVRRDRITVVDNGIDVDALTPAPADRAAVRSELGLADDDVALVVVGRLDPVKRVDEVLRACAPRLAAGGHVLLVAGAGSLLGDLQALAADLGVSHAVRWLGPRGDVPRVLAAADVALSASRDETFGMAVVEAVASGLPVVFVQCPALTELSAVPEGAVEVAGGPDGLRAGLDELQRRGLHRRDVPAELSLRYGAAAAASAVDALYRRLLAHRS
nr:glycosyltransferase [Kineococcus siccus]